MAAAVNAFRTMLGRMTFSQQAAQVITDEYNITDPEDLLYYDDDQCEHLCQLIRKPGGRVAVPVVPAGVAPAAPQAAVGHAVGPGAEEALKLLVFYIQYMHNTSREIQVAQVTLAKVQEFCAYRDSVKKHKNT